MSESIATVTSTLSDLCPRMTRRNVRAPRRESDTRTTTFLPFGCEPVTSDRPTVPEQPRVTVAGHATLIGTWFAATLTAVDETVGSGGSNTGTTLLWVPSLPALLC